MELKHEAEILLDEANAKPEAIMGWWQNILRRLDQGDEIVKIHSSLRATVAIVKTAKPTIQEASNENQG